MSIQDIHNARLKYIGGNAEGRMQKGKLDSLKKSLFNSYQAETAILKDGRKFKCLINPSKLKADYDVKVISIPFEDICLNEAEILANQAGDIDPDMMVFTPPKTSEGIQKIGLKVGDVFEWEETHTHWLVDLRHIEEDSYFRAEIHRCDQQVTVNNIDYWVYIRGPVETDEKWSKSSSFYFEELNYSLVMYITQDENTSKFFHRNQKMKIKEDNWEIVSVNDYYLDGVIEVFLKEDYNNFAEDMADEEALPQETDIIGADKVSPYDTVTYSIENKIGKWEVQSKKVKIISQNGNSVTLEITTGKSGEFDLIFNADDSTQSIKHIIIESL